jgi:hypothetical protein
MNITISKKSTLRIIAILAALALLIWGGSWALSNGYPARWFSSPTHAPQDQPALRAVSAMYSADPASERSVWEDTVCSGMTLKGCSLFRTMYAPAIWAATSQKNEAAANMIRVVDTLEDGSQIWLLSVVTKTASGDVFIQVSADPTTGQWLLEHVLFTQEAAKYAQ